MRSKLIVVITIGIALVTIAGIALFGPDTPKPTAHVNEAGNSHKLTVYKSATCGCCGIWTDYMKNKGYQIDVVNTEELDAVKEKYNVPESLYSCHTTIINDGDYFIEGHIPEEAVAKLIDEEPNIAGIGMPGMPSGSPGMPGNKIGPFDISGVAKDDKINQFMSI